MRQLLLTAKWLADISQLQIAAQYGHEVAFNIPTGLQGIEAAISRLQVDISREAATRRRSAQPAEENPQAETSAHVSFESIEPAARSMGDMLFKFLFDGPTRQLYDRAIKERNSGDESLVITLVLAEDNENNPLQHAPWLNGIPWEVLWDEGARTFIATAGSTFFSRAIGDAVGKVRSGPLKILIMAASPQIYEGRRLERLRGALEIEQIKEALDGQRCEIRVVQGESIDDLEEELFQNDEHKHFDVFHFIGHGDFDTKRKEGYLLFREPDGAGGVPIYASYLRNLLSDPWSPLLVVLNSCSGAQGFAGDTFSSTAAMLSLGRKPAVVAMQFPITDRAAIEFGAALYRWLGRGATVQDAVRRARWKLGSRGPEWIIPVLYLRSPDYRLVSEPHP